MPWGNCWTYALPRWRKNPHKTYLILRLSHESWLPVLHVFFANSIENTQVEEFKPSHWTKKHIIHGRLGWLFRKIPLYAVCFHGRIRTGLGEEKKDDKPRDDAKH